MSSRDKSNIVSAIHKHGWIATRNAIMSNLGITTNVKQDALNFGLHYMDWIARKFTDEHFQSLM